MEIGEVFDQMAPEYTAIMDDMVPHYRKLIGTMVTGLPPAFSPKNILDLGAGNGNVTAICKSIYPGAEYTLVDASKEMLDNCRARFGGTRNTYVKTLFREMEFEAGAIDLVVAGFSVHHVPAIEKPQLFSMIRRLLAEGGVFTSADLFVNKHDEPYHSEVLAGWKAFVLSNGRTEEDWQWLTDHYAAYDRPSAFHDQQVWMKSAGFKRVVLTWNDGAWGCYHAYK